MIWRVATSNKRPVKGIPIIFPDETEASACAMTLNERNQGQAHSYTYTVIEVPSEFLQSVIDRGSDTASVQELLFPSIPIKSTSDASANVLARSNP